MKTTKEYINLLRGFKQSHADEYGINRMGLFGSVARGEQRENSDIDVFFEADRISLFRMGGLMYDLKKLFGAPVDVVHSHKNMNPKFRQRIEKDMIYV